MCSLPEWLMNSVTSGLLDASERLSVLLRVDSLAADVRKQAVGFLSNTSVPEGFTAV